MSDNQFSSISSSPLVDDFAETPIIDPGTQGQTNQKTTSDQGVATPGYVSAPGHLGDSIFGSILPPALPEAGETHQKMVEQHIKERGSNIIHVRLAGSFSGSMYVMGGKAVVIIYSDVMDAIRDADITPKSSVIEQAEFQATRAYKEQTKSSEDPTILSTIIIFKESYPKHRACANYILSTLIHNQPNAPTVAGDISTLSPEKFRVNYNQGEIRTFIEQTSPDGVLDYSTHYIGLDILHNGTWKLIAAQGHYTEIYQLPNNNFGGYGGYNTQTPSKFVPMIHLQCPITTYPHLSLLGIMLPLAMFEFGQRGLWQIPFRTFHADKPNLGSLFSVQADTGKPPFIADAGQFDATLREFFTDPFYALDILHGKPNIPGITLFAEKTPQTNFAIGKIFSRFFNNPQLQQNEYVYKVHREIVGAMNGSGGTRIDTRSIDFFEMIKTLTPEQLERFRVRGSSENERIKLIREIHQGYDSDIEARYLNNTAILNGTALSSLGAAIGGRINIETPERLHQAGLSAQDLNLIMEGYRSPMTATFNFTAPQQYNPHGGNYQNRAYYQDPFGYRR